MINTQHPKTFKKLILLLWPINVTGILAKAKSKPSSHDLRVPKPET
jgi:hypothetical protein